MKWKYWRRRQPFDQTTSRVSASFMFLGALLLGYPLLELIPDRGFSVLFKFGPVLLGIPAFGYLRENRLKINDRRPFSNS